jgi:predicted CXXCH cytochrome family protein
MQQRPILLLLTFGLITILAGAAMLFFGGSVALAQDDDKAEYIGTDECESCHRKVVQAHGSTFHAQTLQDVERSKEAIKADFSQGEDLRMVTFPNQTTARAFTIDDIALVVGSGKRVQRYLYEVESRVYQVLPAEWNVETNSWQPLSYAATWPDPAYDWGQNCAYCHVTGYDIERGRWEEEGVQCEACHGPGSVHQEKADDAGRNADDDELAELRGAINPAVDPQVCGQCHARGTSASGQPYPVGYLPGSSLTDSYTLAAPEDSAHWYSSGHALQANMQYNEWLLSGHATSLTNLRNSGEIIEESCLSCHSADYAYTSQLIAAVQADDRSGTAPEMPTGETALFGVTCVSCHDPHSEAGRPTQLINEPYLLCVSCHSNALISNGVHHPVQEMFEGTQIVGEVQSRPSDHFADVSGPDCQTCHLATMPVESGTRMSHVMKPLLPGATLDLEGVIDTCAECHGDQVDPPTMQKLIDDIQQDTKARIEQARAAVNASTPDWVITVLDFVEGDGSNGVHNYAYADELLDAVFAEMGLFPPAQP